MGKHKPAQLWAVKPVGTYPQIYVRTNSGQSVAVLFCEHMATEGIGFVLPRRDMRLLAKRINQCLDATK